jgi:transcriptional regulator with XRE-family HTH domain
MLLNLRFAIAARGFKQVDLAMRLTVPPSTLSEVVNGRRTADATLRSRIAQVLDVDETWLFSNVVTIPRATTRELERTAMTVMA